MILKNFFLISCWLIVSSFSTQTLTLKFQLLTTYYNEKSPHRVAKYKRCFVENCNNQFIDKLY